MLHNDGVRIAESVSGIGMALVAERHFQVGETLLSEEPDLLGPSGDPVGQCAAFKKLPLHAQTRILNGYFYDLSSTCERMQHIRSVLPRSAGTHVLQVAAIFNFNAAACYLGLDDCTLGECLGAGLFYTICKANHSCSPNSYCTTVDRSGRKVLRSIQPIERGDEITLSYNVQQELKPRLERQISLQKCFGFHCACKRCTAADDTRPFPCKTMSCTGKCYMELSEDSCQALVSPCSVCRKQPSQKDSEKAFKQEVALQDDLNEIDRILSIPVTLRQKADLIYLVKKIPSLCPVHPHHHLAYVVTRFQKAYYSEAGQQAKLIDTLLARIDCFEALAPAGSYTQDYEDLGDAYMRTGQKEPAAECYKSAQASYSISHQSVHPLVRRCGEKMVQLLQHHEIESDTRAGKTCANSMCTGKEQGDERVDCPLCHVVFCSRVCRKNDRKRHARICFAVKPDVTQTLATEMLQGPE